MSGNGSGGAREGDWECSGCSNRNYAFRCFCNRCKQPRVLVDHGTPADSKWLPRIGDWICTGCTNNNYASRENCKKCDQPKAVAAMPVAMNGPPIPAYPNYYARAQVGMDQKMNLGMYGNGGLPQLLPLASSWGGNDMFGLQPPQVCPIGGTSTYGAKGWRNGDWICSCGFHNYSSRAQCKKCGAPMLVALPSSLISSAAALGTKRLASEELVHELENKRLNAGQTYGLQQAFSSQDSLGGSGLSLPAMAANLHMPPSAPSHLGIGAKHWRDGDWMCSSCNNHNYSSRSECNRCKTHRDAVVQSVSSA